MDLIPISRKGYERFKEDLAKFKKERPEIIQAIKEAREEGDLKENAGYDAARERQTLLEIRINDMETQFLRFDVIDNIPTEGDTVVFGATVEMEDLDTGETKRYTLLGPDESDPAKGSISILSPVGHALVGKCEGDEVVVEVPRGKIEYEITSISFEDVDAVRK
jgi:transcription elongation factor GreA